MHLNIPRSTITGMFLAGLLALAPSALAQVLVDDFGQNQGALIRSALGTDSSTVTGTMLGGERDLQATLLSGTSISAEATTGNFRVSQAGDATGTVEIVWDGLDGDGETLNSTGLGALDFTSGAQDAFLLGVSSSTHNLNVALLIHSSTGTRTGTVAVAASALPGNYRVPYSTFTGSGDFTTVGAIQLIADSTPGLDLRVDFLRTTSTASVPPLEATLTDILLVDNDGNGKASAGDTLRYVVNIANNDPAAKTGVEFNANIPANTLFSAGSLTASPLARNDSAAPTSVPGDPFHTPFQTILTVGSADPDENLLLNDFLGAPAASITQFGGGTLGGNVDSHNAGSTVLVDGHSLLVNADGSFTYEPKAGFTGLFTFQYRLANATGSGIAATTIAVGARPSAGDDTFGVTGNVLLDTSTLVSLSGNDTGDALVISGNTAPTHGSAALNLAMGHFTYTPNRGYTGPDSFTYTIGNGFGDVTATVSLTVNNMIWFIDETNNGGDGRSHSPYQTIAAFNTVNTGSSGNPAIGQVIFLRDGTYSDGITLLNNQKLVGDGWSGTFETAAGFALAPGSVVADFSDTDPIIAPASGNGINLASGNAIRGVTVGDTPAGYGFSGSAVGNLLIAESSVTGQGGTMSISSSGAFGTDVNFETLESTSSAGANLNLVGVTGTLAFSSHGNGFSGSAAGSAALRISGGNVSLAYTGPITKSTSGAVLDVSGGHAGTLAFTGTLTGMSASGGINLNNANGSVALSSLVLGTSGSRINNQAVTISGGVGSYNLGAVSIFANNVRGIFASNADGVLTITSGTVDAGTATAIDIDGPAGLTTLAMSLTRVVSTGGSASGIMIQDAAGSVTITGTGTPGSGGILSSKSGSDGATTSGIGIYLRNCSNISLARLQLNDLGNFAILGSEVSGFILTDSVINGVNGTSASADEGSVAFNNLTGATSITGTTIEGGIEDNLRVINTVGSLDRLTLDGVSIGLNSTASGDNGILLQAQNSAVLNTTIQNSTFAGARGDVFQLDLTGTASSDLLFKNNLSINAHSAVVVGGGGITLSGGGSLSANPTLTYDIDGNTFRNARGDAILIALQTGAGAFTGQVRNNTIGDAALDRSGSSEASGIEVRTVGAGVHVVTISNNQVRQYSNYGLLLQAGQLATSPGAIYATVLGNTIANPSSYGFAKNGIHLNLGTLSGDTHFACVDILNNTIAGSGDNGGPDINLRQRQSTSAQLPGYSGMPTDTAAIATFVAGQNGGSPVVIATTTVAGFTGGGACIP